MPVGRCQKLGVCAAETLGVARSYKGSMPTTFRPCAPDQSLLFPPSPRDWLPEGHLAFFIADTVAALDLKAFYAPYAGDGRRNQPFEPQMMNPTEVLADAGYRSDATFQTLETRQVTAYISLGREGQSPATPNPAHEATRRMAARLASDRGRARYRRRKAIVEPVIGWIKEVLGFRRFSLRGEPKARGEWTVVCLAVNLKRFHRIRMA